MSSVPSEWAAAGAEALRQHTGEGLFLRPHLETANVVLGAAWPLILEWAGSQAAMAVMATDRKPAP